MRNSVLLAFGCGPANPCQALRHEETGLSSKAEPISPKSASVPTVFLFAGLAALICAPPVAAQDDGGVTEPEEIASDPDEEGAEAEDAEVQESPPERVIIDLTVTVPRNESDRVVEERCEEEADAAQITNGIVVCRRLGEATDGSWNREEWEREYAQRTQGQQPVNTFGIPNHGNPIGFGSVPPPALIIDVEALPQAPEGSDADRIARGLPPLGEDPEPTAEEIAERRRELGLDAPPIPEE